MSVNRWQVHRAGILNYWYYDEAEFLFAGGRLMLRGSNGSGKSVTMQSLVTVLLDGVTQARRLDSFGSQSRRIEDYLLGEREISEVDERTGYLFFEYKREETEQYVTTGIGLHAKRGTGRVDFWGFVLENGRRVGTDFALYHLGHDPETGKTVKIPLSRRELVHAIGADGQVVSSHSEYMALVNARVYGFRELGQYEELMRLLIQLRSPKLSRDFKPTVIYEILNASLPALTDEELRPLSETLANIEQTRLSLEQMRREEKAFSQLCQAYTAYNQSVLGKRASLFLGQRERLQAAERRLEAIGGEKKEAEALCAQAATAQQSLTAEESRLREEQKALMSNEAFQAAEEKKQRLDERAQLAKRREQKADDYAAKRRRELTLTEDLRKAEAACEALRQAAAAALAALGELAADGVFPEHAALAAEATAETVDDALAQVFRQRLKDWRAHLRAVRAAFADIGQRREELARLAQEFSEELRQLDVYKEEKAQAERALGEARQALVAQYYEWKKAYAERLPVEEETKLLGMLADLYETCDWQDVTEVLEAAQTAAQQRLLAQESEVRLVLTETREAREAKEAEIAQLKEAREAEPEQHEAVRATRARLRAAGIPCQSFYEAVEFKKEVSPETRERLESALTEAGLLQALILADDAADAQLTAEDYGAVLRAGEPVLMGQSLCDYLEPTPDEAAGVTKERIAAVLGGIKVTLAAGAYPAADDGVTCIDIETGGYAQGCVSGHAPHAEGARYIGRQAREALRRRQLAAAEAELAALRQREERQQAELAEIAAARAAVLEARRAFPAETACRTQYEAARAKEAFITQQAQRVEEKDAQQKERQLALRERIAALRELRADDALAAEDAAYEAAERQELDVMFRKAGDLRSAQSLAARDRDDLADTRAEADRLRGEQLELEARDQWLGARLAALDELLAALDAAAIEQRIAAIAARLDAVPEELRQAVREETEARGRLRQLAQESERLTRACAERHQLTAAAEKLVEAERAYAFLPAEDLTPQGIAALAKAQESSDAATLAKRFTRVSNAYQESQSVLTEYRLILQTAETALALPAGLGTAAALAADDATAAVLFPEDWQVLREAAARQLVLTVSGSRKESPYAERDALVQRLAEQQNLLSEQDEALYKQIIMNSIGATISAYIYDAERWVSQMNAIMAQSETSSGLRFHLSWKPDVDAADAAGGENLREVVRLLHADPGALTEEDRGKLMDFFKNRVDQARAIADADDKSADAWSPAVRDMLDYRQWFAFQLSYDKGEKIRRRQLTDRNFLQFSGGEKAMAMYTPLFSAAYSRYQEAAPDAPRLITLDEAFAGVDEQNMRDMFRLVESMHFNYIMNSQAVWGEYDVVPELNIYNLLRPLNKPFVTLVKFHWNGRVRQPLDAGAEGSGETEAADDADGAAG